MEFYDPESPTEDDLGTDAEQRLTPPSIQQQQQQWEQQQHQPLQQHQHQSQLLQQHQHQPRQLQQHQHQHQPQQLQQHQHHSQQLQQHQYQLHQQQQQFQPHHHQQQLQLQQLPFIQQQQLSVQPFKQHDHQLRQQHPLVPQQFQLLCAQQRLHLQQKRQWNLPDVNAVHQSGRTPLLQGSGVGPAVLGGVGLPQQDMELKDVDLRVKHRENHTPWYHELTSALRGAQGESTEVEQAQGKMPCMVKENPSETTQGEQTDAETAQGEKPSVSRLQSAESTASPAPTEVPKESPESVATDLQKEEPINEEKPEEPQTLAKKLLNKALGNVNKMGKTKPSTAAMSYTVSSVPGKLAFSMRRGKVQKVSFGIRSKKNVLKASGEGHEEEEEGAKVKEDPTQLGAAQPARFKKSMAELFRPDQDAPAEVVKQQQLIHTTQTANIQVLKQNPIEITSGQGSDDSTGQPKVEVATKEEESNQKEQSTEMKERKSRKVSRWSKPEEKERNIALEVAIDKARKAEERIKQGGRQDFPEEMKTYSNLDQSQTESEKHSLPDQKSQALAELSELYKDVADSETIPDQEEKQNALTESDHTTAAGFDTKQNVGKEDGSCATQKSQQQSGGKEDAQDQQGRKSEQRTVEVDSSVKEAAERSPSDGQKNRASGGKTSRVHRSDSSSREQSSRKKDDSGSHSHRKENGRKSDKSASRERGTEKNSKMDKDKERKNTRRSRSEDRDKDYRRRDRSKSQELPDKNHSRSPSRSTDRLDKKQSHLQDDSREKSRAKQHADSRCTSERKQTKRRERSRSVEGKQTKHRDHSVERRPTQHTDHSRSTERRQTDRRDRSRSTERKQTDYRDRSRSTERRQTEHRDRSRSTDRKQTEHTDHSRSTERKQTDRRDRSRSTERKQTDRRDRSRSTERKQAEHTDNSRSTERKQTDRRDRSRSTERKQTEHRDRSRSTERKQTDAIDRSRNTERRQTDRRDRSRSTERRQTQHRDRSRSTERRQTVRRDRSRSTERRHTQLRDHSRSVERKQTEHRDQSMERKQRLRRDRSRSTERRPAQCKDRSRSSERRETQHSDSGRSTERRQNKGHDCVEDKHTKQRDHSRSIERIQTQHTDYLQSVERGQTQSKDRSRSVERGQTQNVDHGRSGEGRKLEPRDQSRNTEQARADQRSHSLERNQTQCGHGGRSMERKQKQHRDRSQSTERGQKEDSYNRGFEKRQTRERDNSIGKTPTEHGEHHSSLERRRLEHGEGNRSQERRQTQYRERSRSTERRWTQDRDHRESAERKQTQLSDHSRSTEKKQAQHRDRSRSAERKQPQYRDCSGSVEGRQNMKQATDEFHSLDMKPKQHSDLDLSVQIKRQSKQTKYSDNSAEERELVCSNKSQKRQRSESAEREAWPRQEHLDWEKERQRKGKYRSDDRDREYISFRKDATDYVACDADNRDKLMPRESTRSPMFGDSPRYHRRTDRSPVRGRESISPDRRRNIRSSDRGRNLRSPDRRQHDRSPDRAINLGSPDRRISRSPEGRRILQSPERGRNVWSPDRRRKSRSPDRKRTMEWIEGGPDLHSDTQRDDRYDEFVSEWKGDHHISYREHSAERDISRQSNRRSPSSSVHPSQYPSDARQTPKDEIHPCYSESYRTHRDYSFSKDGEKQYMMASSSNQEKYLPAASSVSSERHCRREESDTGKSQYKIRSSEDFSLSERRKDMDFVEFGSETRHRQTLLTDMVQWEEAERNSPRTARPTRLKKEKKKSDRSNTTMKSKKGLKLKLKSRSTAGGDEGQGDHENTKLNKEVKTVIDTPGTRSEFVSVDTLGSDRFKKPTKAERSDYDEGMLRKRTQCDSGNRGIGSDHEETTKKGGQKATAKEKLQPAKKHRLSGDERSSKTSTSEDETNSLRKISARNTDTDLTISKSCSADQETLRHAHCDDNPSMDLQKKVNSSSSTDQSARENSQSPAVNSTSKLLVPKTEKEHKQKHTSHSDTTSEEKLQGNSVSTSDPATPCTEKRGSAASEKVDVVSTIKTESVMTSLSSSPRTKAGRFGTASWSSGSKRRERILRPSLDPLAARSKSASLKTLSPGSKISSCEVSAESSDSGGTGNNKSTTNTSDVGVYPDSKAVTSVEKISSKTCKEHSVMEAIKASSVSEAFSSGATTDVSSTRRTADLQIGDTGSVVAANSVKVNKDDKRNASGRKQKPHPRGAARERAERDMKSSGKEEQSRGTPDSRAQHSKDSWHRNNESPNQSHRYDNQHKMRPHEADERERHHNWHQSDEENDFELRDRGRGRNSKKHGDCHRETNSEREQRHPHDNQREHKRVHQGFRDEHRHKRRNSGNRDHDLESFDMHHTYDRNDELHFSPISPEDSKDEFDDFQACGTPEHFRTRDTGSSRPRGLMSTLNRHDMPVHSPESFKHFEDRSDRFFRAEKDRKLGFGRERGCDWRRERSPGPPAMYLDRQADQSFDDAHRWGEETGNRRRNLLLHPVQYAQDISDNRRVGEHSPDVVRPREERDQRHSTFTRSCSLERDECRSQSREREGNLLASRSHSQEREERFNVHSTQRSHSQVRDRCEVADERSHSQEGEQRLLTRDNHQGLGFERVHEICTGNRKTSHSQTKERLFTEANTNQLSQYGSQSPERNKRHFVCDTGQLRPDEGGSCSTERHTMQQSENTSRIYTQERDQGQYVETKLDRQNEGALGGHDLKPVESPMHGDRAGAADLKRDTTEEQKIRDTVNETEKERRDNPSQVLKQGEQGQSEIGNPSLERGFYRLDPSHIQGQNRGEPRLFEGVNVNPACVSELAVPSRSGESTCVHPPALSSDLPHSTPSHHTAQSQTLDSAQCSYLPESIMVQYPQDHTDPQTDWQAGAYLSQVDPTTLQLLCHQYQAMGYSPEQALLLVIQCISSSIAQQTGVAQQAGQHGGSAIGTEPAALVTVTGGSVLEGHDHQQLMQGQQLSADLLHQHVYQSSTYPLSYTHLQQSHIPSKNLAEIDTHQPGHSGTSQTRDLSSSIPQEIQHQSLVLPFQSGVQAKDVNTLGAQASGTTNLNSEIPELLQTDGKQIKASCEVKNSHQSSLSREREDIVSSTNSTESEEVSAKQQQSSGKEQTVEQPLKVKSRWRRSCEAESSESTPSEPVSELQEKGEAGVLGKRTQSRDSIPTLPLQKRLKLSAEAGQSAKVDGVEDFPTFERITDNIHLTQRKRSKSMKRMQCDCTMSKADRVRGVPACTGDCLNRMLMIECGSKCPCLVNCSNKRFQKKQYAKTEPFYCGAGKGWGLKASEDLPQVGTFVMEYVGELLGYKEFVRRTRQYARQGLKHHYFMALNADEVIDATLKGSNSRFLNHSCDPNCETQKWTVNGELRVGFFTKKPVGAGEELTFDYQFEFYGEPQKCSCGSQQCRGFIGGQKNFPLKKKKRERRWEWRRKVGLFEDEMLDEDMDSISCLEDGMKLKDHVLDLCRLMVRARKHEHRLSLLKILQNTTEINCLRLFLGYQGLPLLWSWMVDLGASEEDCNIKMQVLSVLQKLPITNRTVLKESKIMTMVEKWATPPGPPALHEVEADSLSEPLPLPLPVPPDRPVVSILTLHKDSKVRNTPKKRVTFADEAVNSDSDVVSSTNNEACGDSKVFTSLLASQVTGDDTVSTSEAAVLSSSDVEVKSTGEDSGQDGRGAGNEPSGDFKSVSSALADGNTCNSSASTDFSVGTSAEHSVHSEVNSKQEQAPQTTLPAEMAEDQVSSVTTKSGEREEDGLKTSDNADTKMDTDSADTRHTTQTEPSSSQEIFSADTSKLSLQTKEDTDTLSAITTAAIYGDLSGDGDQTIKGDNARQQVDWAEDGSGPPQLECMEEEKEDSQAVPSTSQEDFEVEDEEMPTLIKEGGELSEQDAELELDPVHSMATQLLCGWGDLKELYKIPKKQRIEERKRTERELECARPENSEPDPYACWKKNKVEKTKKKELEEEEMKKLTQAAAGPKLSKEVRRQLFEAQVKAEDQLNAELQRQHEAHLQQQQAAAVLLLQQNPALAAVLQGLGHDLSFLSSQGQVYDSSQLQYSSMVTADQQGALVLATQAAGGDVATLTQLSQPGLVSHALDPGQQQMHAVYASSPGAQVFQDPAAQQLQQQQLQQQQLQQQQIQQQQLQQQQQLAVQQMALQQMTAAAQQSPTVLAAQCVTPTEDEDVPPPPSPPEQGDTLPEHWKRARDGEGRVYYYNTLTRATQWDLPTVDGSSPSVLNMDSTEAQEEEGMEEEEEESKRKTTTAAADTSSEVARKIKDRFRKQMSKFVVLYLDPYRRQTCKSGRIQTTEDFKHLARRLTHHVMAKELKHCRHVEDLEVNENVKAKARDYVRKYMSRCGPVFKKSSSPDEIV